MYLDDANLIEQQREQLGTPVCAGSPKFLAFAPTSATSHQAGLRFTDESLSLSTRATSDLVLPFNTSRIALALRHRYISLVL